MVDPAAALQKSENRTPAFITDLNIRSGAEPPGGCPSSEMSWAMVSTQHNLVGLVLVATPGSNTIRGVLWWGGSPRLGAIFFWTWVVWVRRVHRHAAARFGPQRSNEETLLQGVPCHARGRCRARRGWGVAGRAHPVWVSDQGAGRVGLVLPVAGVAAWHAVCEYGVVVTGEDENCD